jgi:hypothetical protein
MFSEPKKRSKNSKDRIFEDVDDKALQSELNAEKELDDRGSRFRVRSRPLGVPESLNYDKVSELIEQIEQEDS